MKVLLVSNHENHAFLLNELEKEGQQTMLLSRMDTRAWSGMVKRAENPQEALDWKPDLAVFDGPGFGPMADKFQKSFGIQTLNGGRFYDRIHADYMVGMDLMDVNGVETPEMQKFKNISDAVEHILGQDNPWLFRYPDGRTHSAPTTQDMQIFLESISGSPPDSFTLQKTYLDLGPRGMWARPEFYLAGLFNHRGLMNPGIYLQTAHNLLPEDLGLRTEEGVTMYTVPIQSELIQKTLLKLELSLKAVKYTGWVFIGCIVDRRENTRRSRKKDLWEPMEMVPVVTSVSLTPPDGFWAAFLRGLKMPFNLFLDRAAFPKSRNTPYEFWDGWVCSRKVTVPPYPMTEAPWVSERMKNALAKELLPKVTVPKEEWGVYWNQVASDGFGGLDVVGPVVGYAVGRGESQHESIREVRNVVQSLPLSVKQAKVEPDPVCEFDIPMLDSWGFLNRKATLPEPTVPKEA